MKVKEVGASLLELSLVLAVGAMIIVGSLQLMRWYSNTMSVQQLKQSVDTTLLLMNQYYQAVDPGSSVMPPLHYCQEDLSSKQFSDLRAWATVTTHAFSPQQLALIQNPLGTAPTTQFVPAQTIPGTDDYNTYWIYQFKISMDFPSLTAQRIQQLQAELNADGVITGKTLTWTRLPGQQLGEELNSLSVASSTLNKKLKLYSQHYQATGNLGAPCPP